MYKREKCVCILFTLGIICTIFASCSQDSRPYTYQDEIIHSSNNPSNTDEIDKNQQIRIVTYHVGEDTWAGTYNEVLNDYIKENPHLNIIDESVPAPGDIIRTKIKTDFASGNEPDICFFFTSADAKPLVESGKLFAYDEELKKDKEWGDNFLPAALDAVRYKDGKIYAIPTIGFYEGLFCNKDLFDRYEIDIPRTYDQLKKSIEIFSNNDIIPIADSISDSYYLIETFILSTAGPTLQNEFFDSSWAKGLDYIKELYHMNAFPKDALTIKEPEANRLFVEKKAAMLIAGSWVLGQIKDQQNTVVIPLPLVPDAKAHPNDIIGGFDSGWYITKSLNDEKNNEPLKMVKYFTSPEIVAKFINKAGVPAMKSMSPIMTTPLQKSGYEMFSKANTITKPIDNKISPSAFSHIRTNMAYIVENKKTGQEVLDEAKALNR